MEQIGNILLTIWNGIVWLVDHWEMIGLILGSVFGSTVGVSWLAKFGCLLTILNKVRLSMKDHTIGDTEAATFFWIIVTLFLGFWPTVNHKVLDCAPDQQVGYLKGLGICKPDYRPEIAAVKNGK